MRVLIWSQHLLGTGHLQRSARIAAALARDGSDVVLANGGPAPAAPSNGYERVDLPAIRADNDRFEQLVASNGAPVDEALWGERSRLLAHLVERPLDAVVVEMFPFGRRAFARELVPLLDGWRRQAKRPRLFVSLRDVLVEKPRPERAIEVAMRVERWFDRVLVHADPRLVQLDDTFAQARRVAAWLRYTGYVGPVSAATAGGERRQGVLVSAGGGAVGRTLLLAAIEAARLLAGALGRWTVITGSGLAERDWRDVSARAPVDVELVRHVDDLPRRLARTSVSVSQAGYNTVVEAMAARCPMVLVPFAAGAETEQTSRALTVRAAGAASLLHEVTLDAKALADAVRARAALPFPPLSLDVDGAHRTACLIAATLAGRA